MYLVLDHHTPAPAHNSYTCTRLCQLVGMKNERWGGEESERRGGERERRGGERERKEGKYIPDRGRREKRKSP